MSDVDGLWRIGLEEGFRVVRRTPSGNVDYEWAREISNSRFDLKPAAVAFPEAAAHVARCITYCVENDLRFRVRSGGHQHEGMSSLDHGVVIRLSELNSIEYRDSGRRAWIGVGKPLKEVYDELELHQKTIPGGGCWSVNVGGLTLGGGWGTSIRKMGLTCDNVVEIEMVTADGEVVYARADNKHSDLFWALRGGGGGNFGIVTRFLFKLWDFDPKEVHTFSMQWEEPNGGTAEERDAYLAAIVRDYLEWQADTPIELTTAMGLRVRHKFMTKYYPVGLSGKFYGKKERLEEILQPIWKKHPPDKPQRLFVRSMEPAGGDDSEPEAASLSDLINEVIDQIYLGGRSDELREDGAVGPAPYGVQAPPSTTCLAPWPHKISSGFPKSPSVYQAFALKAVQMLRTTHERMPENTARLYMVLHAMPGKKRRVQPEDTAFFWHDKDILVQFQAWWARPCLAKGDIEAERAYQLDQERYICWICDARQQFEPELEGAFINFVDRDLPLEAYYGGNLARLQEIRRRYDSGNVFRFPMSVGRDELPSASELTSFGIKVVTRGQSEYRAARRISNSRFDRRPLAVAYPKTAEQVARCVNYCRTHRLALRVRSGGHQHEGMCSADDSLMVRLSEMNRIEYVTENRDQAWIGVGARLKDVYDELQESKRIIAGGGCRSVNVGGLTLGGGWGLSARKFGLACDNVLAAEVVLADGTILIAKKPEEKREGKGKEDEKDHSDLLWALLGSGGGNFGIVTRFLFKLHAIYPNLSTYKLYWTSTGHDRKKIIKRWLEFQRAVQSTDTTSYLVLHGDLPVRDPGVEAWYSVYAGGASYCEGDRLETEVEKLTSGLPKLAKGPIIESLFKTRIPDDVEGTSATRRVSVASLLDYADTAPGHFDLPLVRHPGDEPAPDQPFCLTSPPKENCMAPHPHKVTSAFPKTKGTVSDKEYDERLADALARFLDANPVSPYVKSYISLYSMGGKVAKISPEQTAFWYRRKDFVVQIESWWSYTDSDPRPCGCRDRQSWQQGYIDWVRSFRDTLRDQGLIEGAFINFVDRDLEPRSEAVDDRKKLLRHYYGDNLDCLMKLKAKWDPTDFFHFEMSIPLKK